MFHGLRDQVRLFKQFGLWYFQLILFLILSFVYLHYHLSAFCNSTCGLWNMEWSVCQKFLNLRFAFKNFEMEDNLELHSVNSTVDSIKTEKTWMREKISVSFAMCCHFISWKKVENWKYCWNNVGNCPRIWPFRYVFQDKGSYCPHINKHVLILKCCNFDC